MKSKRICLNICDFLIEVRFLDTEGVLIQKEWYENIKKWWGKYLVRMGKRTSDHVIELINFSPGEQLFVSKKSGDYYQIVRRINSKRIQLSYAAGVMQFMNILRDVLLRELGDSGIGLHASGCVDSRGNVYIFMADSGGGKSTTSTMLESAGWEHFGDDSLIIRKIKGKYLFYSPPYAEKTYLPKRLKVESNKVKLFFVNKASKKVFVEEIVSKNKAFKRLFGALISFDGNITKKKMEFMWEIVNSLKIYNLYRNLSKNKLLEVLNEVE